MNTDFLKNFLVKQQEIWLFLKTLFLNPQTVTFLKYLGIGLAVLILFQVLRSRLSRSRSRRVTIPTQPGGKRAVKKEAKRAEKQKDFQQAGEMYRMIGYHDKAIEMYKLAGSNREVASLYEQEKKWEEAAEYYEKSGNLEKAAVMCQKQGSYVRAGEFLVKSKRFLPAAEMFERGESYKLATDLYQQTGHPQKAAACYEKMGETARAAELYEQCYFGERTKRKDSTQPGGVMDRGAINEYAHEAGRLYLVLGQYQKAATVFTAAGLDAEAADALMLSGEYQKAAEIYYDKKLYEKAAQAYEKGGDLKKSYQIQGEIHLENGARLEAAQCFERAGNFRHAAEMYEQLENSKKAGEMYLQERDYQKAAEIFLSAGEILLAAQSYEHEKNFKEAAELYQKIQQPEKALELYKQLNEHYTAATVLYNLGRREESITLLQRVDTSSADYYQASLLLGKIFVEQGMLDAAKERYHKVFSAQHPGQEALEYFYQLGLAFEKNHEYEEALTIHEKILAEDFSFRDVKARADGLRRALTEVKRALGEAKTVSAKPAAVTIGDAKGRYKILKKVGQGGMGVVYQAEDTVLHRIVAYKVLPPAVRESPKILENFLQEARVAAALTHANIVTVYDTGKHETDLFITMEFVDGMTLKEYLERRSPIPLPELVQIAKQICLGLEYAHHRNVIHRDIKPANIMLTKDHIVKIMDFGLAKLVDDSLADKTTVKGTPMYMAPEQILGRGVDHQSDIYSLGCTLFRMATGRAPFTDGDLYYHHLHTPPPSPKQFNPQIPKVLEQMILKCIKKDKAQRYQKVHDILQDLENNFSAV
jgi:tetratricopeptide (TPR) repeat protein